MQRHEPKFIVDFMLGRLAKWLRVVGYDTEYFRDHSKSGILLKSLKENRILVTRDHSLSRKKCWRLILIKNDCIADQLRQLVAETGIEISRDRFFTRCTVCNGPIYCVEDKKSVRDMVPEFVYQNTGVFSRCATCGKVYWEGTHLALLLKDLSRAGIRVEPL